MKLTFLGATHEVTGSCYYLEAAGKKFLVDCGMEQGKNIYENKPIPVPPSELDFMLLTHAHIDHSGNIPLIYSKGFRGNIYSTNATASLCNIMLKDSAHIQEFEAEWRNRKGQRAGRPEYVPIYTMSDAENVLKQFKSYPYNEYVDICNGIRIRFLDAGHLLGSSSIELWLTEGDITKKIVFSGDIGNFNQPLIRDPEYISEADCVIMESTYGDRLHDRVPDYVKGLADVIQETFNRGGNVVIPSFAVGRTQEMLYFIRQIKEQKLVKGFDNFKVYLDSPLAIEASTIFEKFPDECYDKSALELLRKGINPISFDGLKTMVSTDESRSINLIDEPKVIISASGMCDAGRIKHHLKHNLWRKDSTILFVGFQAIGTPGRSLVDGAKMIKIFGEEITVQAEIKVLPGVSGHADKDGLFKWISAMGSTPKKVFVCHGDDSVTDSFADYVHNGTGLDTYAPYSGAIYDIASNMMLETPAGVVVEGKSSGQARNNVVYEKLVDAGNRLMTLIKRIKGYSNKDLAKITDQINSFCDKWE